MKFFTALFWATIVGSFTLTTCLTHSLTATLHSSVSPCDNGGAHPSIPQKIPQIPSKLTELLTVLSSKKQLCTVPSTFITDLLTKLSSDVALLKALPKSVVRKFVASVGQKDQCLLTSLPPKVWNPIAQTVVPGPLNLLPSKPSLLPGLLDFSAIAKPSLPGLPFGIPDLPSLPILSGLLAKPSFASVPCQPFKPSLPSVPVPCAPTVPPVPAPSVPITPPVPVPSTPTVPSVVVPSTPIPSIPDTLPCLPSKPIFPLCIFSLPPKIPLPSIPCVPVKPVIPSIPCPPTTPAPPVPDPCVSPSSPELPSPTPGLPVIPTPPAVPGVPTPPAVPGLPTPPVVPALPTPPAVPGVPTLPVVPETPTPPAVPGVPTLPAVPEIPTPPAVPGSPTLPTGLPTPDSPASPPPSTAVTDASPPTPSAELPPAAPTGEATTNPSTYDKPSIIKKIKNKIESFYNVKPNLCNKKNVSKNFDILSVLKGNEIINKSIISVGPKDPKKTYYVLVPLQSVQEVPSPPILDLKLPDPSVFKNKINEVALKLKGPISSFLQKKNDIKITKKNPSDCQVPCP